MNFRIMIMTATGRRIAAGGRFATPEAARAWALTLADHGVTIGAVVENAPAVDPDSGDPPVESAGWKRAAEIIRTDYRAYLAANPLPRYGPMLDIDEYAEYWGISKKSIKSMMSRGEGPMPDEGKGTAARWLRSTIDGYYRSTPGRRGTMKTRP